MDKRPAAHNDAQPSAQQNTQRGGQPGGQPAGKRSGGKASLMGRVKLWPIVTLLLVVALIVVFRMRANGTVGETPGLVILLVLLLAIIGSVTMFGLTILRNLFVPEEDGQESQIDLKKRALQQEIDELRAQRAQQSSPTQQRSQQDPLT